MASFSEIISKVFSSGHKGPMLGIDIGSSFIKVVLLEKVGEKITLKNYGELALGPRAGSAIGQATNLPPEKIAEALRDLLQETGIVASHTLMAIPFSASLLSVVELPDVPKSEIDTMVPIEARRYIPVPITEVSLDWWVLPKSKNKVSAEAEAARAANVLKPLGKIDVIIAAIHNDIIGKYELIKRDAHIPGGSSHFEIEIFSTLRAVVGADMSPTLVIDIGAGSTKLALIDEGIVRGSHVVGVGGQDITLNISRAQGAPFDKAEEIKCRVGLLGEEEGRDVLSASDLLLATVFGEAVHFVENYENKYETKIEKVILTGGGSRLKGLEKITAEKFPKTTVLISDPFVRVDAPEFLSEKLKDIGPSYSVALGIALKGLEG